MITRKLLFGGEGTTLLVAEDVSSLLKGIFLPGEMRKYSAVGLNSPQSPGFPKRFRGRGDSSLLVDATNKGTSKEGTFLVRRGIPCV